MAQSNHKENKEGAESSGLTMLDLPDDALQHILSFLPSRETVRTCILSKHCRYLWKYVPTLRINETVERCKKFLSNFLLSRDHHSPIHICNIQFNDNNDDNNLVETHDFNTWIFYVIAMCNVRELRVADLEGDFLMLDNQALVSRHLMRLELNRVILKNCAVDFSGCPSLEDLLLMFWIIDAEKITSRSVKRLTMETCEFNGGDTRTHIDVPNAISLKLTDIWNQTPLLESMPLLEYACVKFGDNCRDFCRCGNYWGFVNEDCYGCSRVDDDKEVVLLQGLSHATHLELTKNEPRMFIFQRDLRRCPIFRNLRTLELNEFFVVANLRGFVCLVSNSHVLEELNLLLFEEPKHTREIIGGYNLCNQVNRLSAMQHLNKVKVKCQKQYDWVKMIISTLTVIGIHSHKITVEVEEDSMSSQGGQLTIGFPVWGYFD